MDARRRLTQLLTLPRAKRSGESNEADAIEPTSSAHSVRLERASAVGGDVLRLVDLDKKVKVGGEEVESQRNGTLVLESRAVASERLEDLGKLTKCPGRARFVQRRIEVPGARQTRHADLAFEADSPGPRQLEEPILSRAHDP